MRKRERGFTLIELLVVIAILGILAGVAVPRVIGAIQTARRSANIANQAMIQAAIERYNITATTPIAPPGSGVAALPTTGVYLTQLAGGRLPPVVVVDMTAPGGGAAGQVQSGDVWGLNDAGLVVIMRPGPPATLIWAP